ncbi:MAG: hypothetical protein IOD12_07900 [Silvanigrellales bacterium]|nr:hypothetical protein [Silvanigrellales bacterium]
MSFSSASVALAVSLLPALGFASQSKNFASCFGDHHGSYLALWAISGADNVVAQVNIGVTDDSDRPARFFQVQEVSKNGVVLPVSSYSWAIRQAIKADAAGTYYGFIKVTAKDAGGKLLYMNINKPIGSLRAAMAINGVIEELNCPLASVRD